MTCLGSMVPSVKSECTLIHPNFPNILFSGTNKDTRGTAYIVYEDIHDAKTACEHLSGFNLLGRYLIIIYWQPNKITKKVQTEKQREELEQLKSKYNL